MIISPTKIKLKHARRTTQKKKNNPLKHALRHAKTNRSTYYQLSGLQCPHENQNKETKRPKKSCISKYSSILE